ncbi:MAG: hypothetical protein HOM58_00330 [Rhodospirillaceae bacterium]|jgi:hypothetical protein|nr:hypothetical protein [Rhodospirillaceae bacterium]MBT5457025.1 hypothetical protein [Rhodospirillaceae bacterium]
MIRVAFTFLAILLGAVLVASAGASAKDLTIDAFYGKFSGGGVAENADSLYFAVTSRDFDVQIRPQGNGFKIDWTSIIRRGGDPNNPNVRRRHSTKTLLPSGAPGVFHGSESGNPLKGKELCWARIRGNTLTLFLMTVSKKGTSELQQYDRTLSGTGMKLMFRSWRDGDRLRSVSGRLIKTAN